MNSKLPKPLIQTSAAVLTLLFSSSAFSAEPLKIFILAGQSNMVGHARAHTIATLYASDSPRDQKLLQLVFEPGRGFSRATLEK